MAIFVNTTQPRKLLEGHEFVWCDAMRDLHFLRPPFTQSKLVRCVKGRVITSITLRLMGVSLSWMNLSGLIGVFLQNILIFRKRIRSMKY